MTEPATVQLSEASVALLLEHRQYPGCTMASLTIRERLEVIEAEAATPSTPGLREALERLVETAWPFSAIDVSGNALPVADKTYHELDEALERAIFVLTATEETP